MKSINSKISALIRNNLNPIIQSYRCNSRVKSSWSPNDQCPTPKVIHRSDISNNANSNKKFYFDLADTSFKER